MERLLRGRGGRGLGLGGGRLLALDDVEEALSFGEGIHEKVAELCRTALVEDAICYHLLAEECEQESAVGGKRFRALVTPCVRVGLAERGDRAAADRGRKARELFSELEFQTQRFHGGFLR